MLDGWWNIVGVYLIENILQVLEHLRYIGFY